MRDLRCAGQPLAGAGRVRVLERFAELRPEEERITGVADTSVFFAVLSLRYALLADRSGDADDAVSCGHAALTAMGMLERNVAGRQPG